MRQSWLSHFEGPRFQEWLLRSALITLIAWFGGPGPAVAQNTGNPPARAPDCVCEQRRRRNHRD